MFLLFFEGPSSFFADRRAGSKVSVLFSVVFLVAGARAPRLFVVFVMAWSVFLLAGVRAPSILLFTLSYFC